MDDTHMNRDRDVAGGKRRLQELSWSICRAKEKVESIPRFGQPV